MAVCTNTVRSGLLVALVVVSVVGFGSLASGAITGETNADERVVQQDGAVFEERIVAEQRGDIARVSVLLDGTDRANLTIGSPDVNYEVSVTVVDSDGDGEVTVQFNTAVAGLDDNETGITAVGEDEIEDYNRTTGPIPGPLDATIYDLELAVDGELTDVGVLVLNERSTEEMSVWTAPNATQPTDSSTLIDTISRTDTVTQGDWAVLAIEVSGIIGYVEDADDLNDPANGLNFSMIEDRGQNQPDQPVNLSGATVVTDSANDTSFVLLDTDNLTVGSEYTATFTIDDRNPLLESDENESVSATFTVVEPDTAADANETEIPENETRTTTGEPTTTAVGTTEDGTTEEGTTEEGITEEVVRTTTAEDEAAVASAGLTGRSIGLVALLVGGTLAVLRRR